MLVIHIREDISRGGAMLTTVNRSAIAFNCAYWIDMVMPSGRAVTVKYPPPIG